MSRITVAGGPAIEDRVAPARATAARAIGPARHACSRRDWLRQASVLATGSAGGWLALPAGLGSSSARAHGPVGVQRPPAPAPGTPMLTADGTRSTLAPLLRTVPGSATALQLMFTGCRSLCPLQGAQFAALQTRLQAAGSRHRLLSVSVDVLGDGSEQLHRWLQAQGADPARWRAAVPLPQSADALWSWLRGTPNPADVHSTQVFVFDHRARLVLRTLDFPQPALVHRFLDEAAAS